MAVAALTLVPRASEPCSTVFVPGGRFLMGSEDGRADERPPHEVQVRPLRVGRTPVTNAEYAWFLSGTGTPEPPWWKDPLFWDPQQPVVGVTWDEAAAYCAWLCGTIGGRWRLPTEAEWEHALAGPAPQAPSAAPAQAPARVGEGPANAFGLLDAGTLVHEWCLDWYAPDAYRFTRRYDPRGSEKCAHRVRRGGSWRASAGATARSSSDPRARAADGGFRVVREVP